MLVQALHENLKEELEKFNVNHLLKNKGFQNQPLSFEEAYLLGAFVLSAYDSELSQIVSIDQEKTLIQSVAALCTFHNLETYQKERSAEQIAGICAAVFAYDIQRSDKGFLHPTVDEVIDNCGMGGDLYRTPNLSTLAGLVAAAGGINVLKHGSPGNTDSVGSSDFLEYCGVNLFPDKKIVEEAVKTLGFAYTDALDSYKRIHLNTHLDAGLAHMNDIIGPLTNPVHPCYMKKRVVGVNHLIPPERIAQAYQILNEKGITFIERGLFVRGFADRSRIGGIDEVSLMPGGTIVTELRDGKIKTYELFAHDFALPEMTAEDLCPGKVKAETSRRILTGEIQGPKLAATLANSAILFYLVEDLPLKDGVDKSRELISSKEPLNLLEDYATLSRGAKK